MRKAALLRSVQRIVGDYVSVSEAAFMWRRHRLMVPYATIAFVAMVAVAAAVGWDDWPTRIAIGAAGSALAIAATTDYRVIAATSEGIVLFRASKIRQYAVARIETLEDDAQLAPVGGTMLAADWQIGSGVYTVPKSSEQAVNRIAAGV